MARRISKHATDRARRLRREATPQELAVWHAISRLRPKFTRQLTIGNFHPDLACHQAKLVVEVDGSQHADSVDDAHRTAWLKTQGWAVIRFWNNEVDDNLDGVVRAIVLAVERRTGAPPEFTPTALDEPAIRTPKTPLPEREGLGVGLVLVRALRHVCDGPNSGRCPL